ncbi:MAG: aminotransferase class IV [Bacteroidota bacterium]
MTEDGRPVGLIETMRAEGGNIPLLRAHLDRLRDSAEAFKYALKPEAVRREVQAAAEAVSDGRVRLVLWPDGAVEVVTAPLLPEPFQTAAIYPEPLEEAGTWRCTSKTTARDHYDRAVDWALDHGVDEPILLNPRGEVMEGARTNVAIREGNQIVTPPLSSGGLPGIARRVLLKQGARERVLLPRDLAEADEVLLLNAVRGTMAVNLVPSVL